MAFKKRWADFKLFKQSDQFWYHFLGIESPRKPEIAASGFCPLECNQGVSLLFCVLLCLSHGQTFYCMHILSLKSSCAQRPSEMVVMNNAVLDICGCISMWTDVFCSRELSSCLGVEVLELIAPVLNCVREFQTVLQAPDVPTSMWGFRLTHILANTGFHFVFLILVSSVTIK